MMLDNPDNEDRMKALQDDNTLIVRYLLINNFQKLLKYYDQAERNARTKPHVSY